MHNIPESKCIENIEIFIELLLFLNIQLLVNITQNFSKLFAIQFINLTHFIHLEISSNLNKNNKYLLTRVKISRKSTIKNNCEKRCASFSFFVKEYKLCLYSDLVTIMF